MNSYKIPEIEEITSIARLVGRLEVMIDNIKNKISEEESSDLYRVKDRIFELTNE